MFVACIAARDVGLPAGDPSIEKPGVSAKSYYFRNTRPFCIFYLVRLAIHKYTLWPRFYGATPKTQKLLAYFFHILEVINLILSFTKCIQFNETHDNRVLKCAEQESEI